ncbi:MAG: PQQ-dependent sugar dehydrogenase [Ferruginibacter sp.]
MNVNLRSILILIFLQIKSIAGYTQTPAISFQSIPVSLTAPIDVVNAGDGSGRIFIAEKAGTVRIYKNGALLPNPFLDISSIVTNDVGGERGFLSIAFHPDYLNNRYFYVYYNNLAGEVTIARYHTSPVNPDSAEFSSGVVLMTIHKPFTNHNGGKLNFGPEGDLYFGTGDGGSGGDPGNRSQNGDSLQGKLFRLDVSNFNSPPYYFIPADNPYVTDPNVRDEIYGLGLRNPWRWSFDRQTHDMWLADVGQDAWEEVNFRPADSTAGNNFGWRCYEGNHTYNTTGCQAPSSYRFPIFEYPHNSSTGGFSITGGYVYRGSEFAFLQGYYICSDYISGNGFLISSNGSGGWNISSPQVGWAAHICGYGEAEDGTLYAVSQDGPFYKVNATTTVPLRLVSFSGGLNRNNINLTWQTQNEINSKDFIIEYSTDGQHFQSIGTVTAKNSAGNNNYYFVHPTAFAASNFYRLQIRDMDGSYFYSEIIKINTKPSGLSYVYPTIIENNMIHVFPDAGMNALELYTSQGQMVFKQTLNGSSYKEIPVSNFAKGIYFIKLKSGSSSVTEKIIIQ